MRPAVLAAFGPTDLSAPAGRDLDTPDDRRRTEAPFQAPGGEEA